MSLKKTAIYLLPIVWLTTSLITACATYANKGSVKGRSLSNLSSIQQSREIASWLEGKMETSIPSRKSQPKKVRMTTCRVNVDNSLDKNNKNNFIFLYQEQAMIDKLSKPYRQRFLQISPVSENNSENSLENKESKAATTLSIAFKPENLQNWINFCNKTADTKVIKYSELGKKVCTVNLYPSDKAYIGKTPENGCPANVRGAVRITNRILLRKTGMETWDRGFNAEGKQVWGAKKKPYSFQKVQ